MRNTRIQVLAAAMVAAFASTGAYAASANVTQIDDVAAGTAPGIAIGANGNALVAYAFPNPAGGENLRLLRCADQACNARSTVDIALTYGIDAARVAVNQNGNPVVVHRDFNAEATGSTLVVTVCGDNACSDPAQSTTIAELPGSAFSTSFGVAIAPDNTPVISFYGGDGLYVAKCSSESCTGKVALTRVASGSMTGFDSAVVVTSGGAGGIGSKGSGVTVAYATTNDSTWNDELHVMRCGDYACKTVASDTVVDSGTWMGWDVSAIAAQGALTMAYFGDEALRVNANGVTTVIDAQGTTGLHSTLASGNDGAPVMAYRRGSDPNGTIVDDLWFARCAASGCASGGVQPVLIDAAGTITRPAMVVTADDLPLIAYIENDAGALMLAKCGTRDCR